MCVYAVAIYLHIQKKYRLLHQLVAQLSSGLMVECVVSAKICATPHYLLYHHGEIIA